LSGCTGKPFEISNPLKDNVANLLTAMKELASIKTTFWETRGQHTKILKHKKCFEVLGDAIANISNTCLQQVLGTLSL
jgi:hypothetical protein